MQKPTLRLYDGFTNNSPKFQRDVKELQALLEKKGFNLLDDGLFGKNTETAVKEFQKNNNINNDGVADKETWDVLLNKELKTGGGKFGTIFPKEDIALLSQLSEIKKYKDLIHNASAEYGLPLSVIAGIGSRESMWGIALRPRGPEGTGDPIKRNHTVPGRQDPLPPDGLGFKRGLMQIDYDKHEFARGDEWKDPGANINYVCKIIAGNIESLAKQTDIKDNDILRAGLAAYDCGIDKVLKALKDDHDVDYYTFGRNYSEDVLNRAGWFQLHGWE